MEARTFIKVDLGFNEFTMIICSFLRIACSFAECCFKYAYIPIFFILHSPRFRRDTISTFEAPQMVAVIILTRDGRSATAKQTKSMEFGGLPDR
jgi:hypothetical protein